VGGVMGVQVGRSWSSSVGFFTLASWSLLALGMHSDSFFRYWNVLSLL
jgi:hypothetical protein